MEERTGMIYIVTSPSRKSYIGKTMTSLSDRKSKHLNAIKDRKRKANYKFANAIKKYGDELKWEILYKDIPISILAVAEMCAIYAYDTLGNGYNCTEGGEGSYGYKHSEETKEKMKTNHKGCTGIKMSKETKRKIGEANGENLRKLAKLQPKGEKSPQAKLTQEQVDKIRASYFEDKESQYKIAKEYKVTRSAIAHIVRGTSWKESFNGR